MTTGRINQVASLNDANDHNTVVGSILLPTYDKVVIEQPPMMSE